jgi:hypothetical protein
VRQLEADFLTVRAGWKEAAFDQSGLKLRSAVR